MKADKKAPPTPKLARVSKATKKPKSTRKEANHAPLKRKPAIGRPTKYEPHHAAIAARVVRLGGTNEDIAAVLRVAMSTVSKWLVEHPAFSEAVKGARDEADANVERALYSRAVGYSHPDTDIRTVAVGDGCSEIVQTPITKHYPPDATSMIFWLKNRQPSRWREKVQVEHSGLDFAAALANARKRAAPGRGAVKPAAR